MAQISIINKSGLESSLRLDAEYYKREYLNKLKQLNLQKEKYLLKNIAFITDGVHSSIDYDGSSKIRCLSAQYVKDNYFDLSANTFISEKQHKANLRTSLKAGDIILSSVGTIGNCSVVTDDILPANADRHVGIIRLTDKSISPFYISAFLNSEYGKFQTIREATGNVQLNLFIDKIKFLVIPKIKEHKEIGDLVEKARKLLLEVNSLYSQAGQILLEELGLKKFNFQYHLFYLASVKETLQNNRIDAEYYNPVYEKMIKTVSKKFELLPLSEIFEFRRGVFVPTSYYREEKTERPYIRIKELTGSLGINQAETIYIDNDYPEDKLNRIKENDLIMAIIGDTIGKTNKIPKELSGGFCSNNTGRLRIKSNWQNRFLPEIPELLFQSLFIQKQIEQKKAQTGQPKINDAEIRAIKIPLINASLQKKISSLSQQAEGKKDNALLLLKKTKKRVEDLIKSRAK